MKKMKQFLSLIVLGITLLPLAGCGDDGPQAPGLAEIKNRYVGVFCTPIDDLDLKPNYRLELKMDSTYKCSRGVYNLGKINRSRCSGTYSFNFDEEKGEWTLVFKPGERKRYDTDECEGTRILWTKKDGYQGGAAETVLPELFDQFPIKKGKCEL